MDRVDVLIVTALQDELEAVLALGEGGRRAWQAARDEDGFPFHHRAFSTEDGQAFEVAAAWSGEMGETAAAARAQHLIDELEPACLAMCGICAGRRGDVALGDVIVADRVYSYDHGKLIAKDEGHEVEFFNDIRTYNLEEVWKMDVAFFARSVDLAALGRERPPSRQAQRWWLLHALRLHEEGSGPPAVLHPDRAKACPAWTALVTELVKGGLVERKGNALSLTEKGRDAVAEDQVLRPDGPVQDTGFQVHVGPIASGKAVQEDPRLFDRLKRLVRKTIGVEMEAAAIGYVGERLGRRAIIVKAVSDHGDHDKDDGFRAFACRASAEFLIAFLQKHFTPERGPRHVDYDPFEDEDRGRFDGRGPADRSDGSLARVERVALLRDPGAIVTRHRAPAPFSGVLEVAVPDGAFVDVRVIAALDQPITEALVTQYRAAVEHRFRRQDPHLRSTLVHAGPQAPPELARSAARERVVLKTFREYQGLLDFTHYLDWQTRWLEADVVYPPWLYVEQPARVSLAGGREEVALESALHELWQLLDSEHPRFSLVLGDFGAGKTFLLHELARRMATDNHTVVPVLVEMSKLEKQRSLKALLAQHFALADVGRIDLDAFQYMLAEGRIALLFDGFDELAQRVTYDRAVEHFETVVQAAQGNAKVVVSSRTQHFLTDQQIKRALAERAEHVPGYRLFKIEKFGETQIRRFLGNLIREPAEAEERYRLLDEVKDLLGLSTNPRMLGFVSKIGPEKLREAKAESGEITAAKLYALLVEQWLDFEHARANPAGAPRGIAREKLRAAMTEVALLLWHRPVKSVEIGELPESLVAAVQAPGAAPIERGVVEHLIGSGSLLVRDAEGRFSFVHRSVLEWLVAEAAAREVRDKGESTALGADAMSALMVDFLVSLAGREEATEWARKTSAGKAEGAVKGNAALVLQRLDKTYGKEGRGEVEITVTVDCEGQDLRGQDFSGVDWRGAKLNRADLQGATLIGARMGGASLVGTRLGRADMAKADLAGADLAGADLSFARLFEADLRGVRNLVQARLRGAKLVAAKGVAIDGVVAAGAAPPVPGGAEPMWVPTAECKAVAWSTSGDLVASGHSDGSVLLWDAVSGQAIRTLSGHIGAVQSVAFSPDGLILAAGAMDSTLRLWEVSTGCALRAFEGHTSGVSSVAFSRDGLTLASGSWDKTLRRWEIATGRALRVFEGHRDIVSTVTFSPDGVSLASGSDDKTARIWELASGRTLCAFAHGHWVTAVAFSPDGLTLASGSADKTVRLWDVATGRGLHAFIGHNDIVRSVAFSPDGLVVASGSDDRTVRLWEVATGRALEGHKSPVRSVAFSPDGHTLASGSSDKTVRLWEVATGRAFRAFEGHVDTVWSVAFSPDGITLASGSFDKTMRLWEVATGRALRAFEGHTGWGTSVAFSPDGRALASGAFDRTVRLWDMATGHALRVFIGHEKAVASIAFSPDGRTLASGSGDETVRLWEVATGRALRALGHKDWVRSVAFSPDGRALASGSGDKTVRLWEVATGRAGRAFKGHEDWVTSVAFSLDGRALASGSSDKTVRLWEVATGRVLRAFEGHKSWVTSVAFSPHGLTLASGSGDKTVRLWEVATGRVLRAFEGHKSGVSSVAFSPDGQTLASASEDGTLRLWDISTARCLAILLATPEGWAAFTPDGRYKLGGDIAGSFWHVIGLCRFEPGELDPYLPTSLRIPDDEPLLPPRPGRVGSPTT